VCLQSVSERDVHVSRPSGRSLVAVPLPGDRGVHPRVQRDGRRVHLAGPAGLVALHDRLLPGGGAVHHPQAAAPAARAPQAGRRQAPQVTDRGLTYLDLGHFAAWHKH